MITRLSFFFEKKHKPMRGQRISCQFELPVIWWSGVLQAFSIFLKPHRMNGTPVLKKETVKSVNNVHLHPPNLPSFRFMELPPLPFLLFPWVDYPCSELPWSLTWLTVDFSLFEWLSALGFWSNSLLLLFDLSLQSSCVNNFIFQTSKCWNVPKCSLGSLLPSIFPL